MVKTINKKFKINDSFKLQKALDRLEKKLSKANIKANFDLEAFDENGDILECRDWNVEIRLNRVVIGQEWLCKSDTQTDFIKELEKIVLKD